MKSLLVCPALVIAMACAATAPPTAEPAVVRVAEPAPAAPASLAPPATPLQRTASGISWEVVQSGTGTVHPTADGRAVAHYEGWTSDGQKFDSSRDRGEPFTFAIAHVIPGWQEVIQLMVPGDRWRVVIPSELAYGDRPAHEGAPAGELTFDIELIDVIQPPAAPEHLSAPDPAATVTASGLAYVVLERGTGSVHPAPNDRVEVHYSGWTTDGRLFDSSVERGSTVTLPVNAVIPGWVEMLQLMVEGDVVRVWIPARLAYGDSPTRAGAPAGMLVFDIELVSIPAP